MLDRLPVTLTSIVLSLVLMGCPSRGSTCTPGQSRAVVFFDRSASAKGTATSDADFRTAVEMLVEKSLTCAEDRVSAYLLFSHTGTAFYKHYDGVTPPMDSSKVDEIDWQARTDEWTRSMANERVGAVSLFEKLWREADVPHEARMHTDILGSLRIIHETFDDAPDSARRQVLYLSDMHESMPGAGRRDFDTRPPPSLAEALAWADADVARLVEERMVPEGALEGVEVRVVRSTLGIHPRAGEVRAYWERVFERLGATVSFG